MSRNIAEESGLICLANLGACVFQFFSVGYEKPLLLNFLEVYFVSSEAAGAGDIVFDSAESWEFGNSARVSSRPLRC
ncbi:MAG: hypothetical protein KDB27_25880 [Planctomycetales bacterium]|nr:hypothetical protein [Planctomycetales bacterium]